MPDLKELFDDATRTARPEFGAIERQHERQRTAVARRKAGAYIAVAAIIALLVSLVVFDGTGGEPSPSIATEPPVAPGVYTVDVTTGDMTPFHDPGSETTWDFELSPDGSTLLMTYRLRGEDTRQLWLADADGTDARPLTSFAGGAEAGTWFSDSRTIAFVGLGRGDVRQVFTVDSRTLEPPTKLTNEPDDVIDPVLTADETAIVYATSRPSIVGDGDTGIGMTPPALGLIRVVDLDSGDVTTLAENAEGLVYLPTITPEGQIAYVAKSGLLGEEIGAIWVTDLDGTDPRPLIERSETITWADQPLWSPDGSLLAYVVEDAAGAWSAWVYEPATGEHRKIAPGFPETWFDDDTLLLHV